MQDDWEKRTNRHIGREISDDERAAALEKKITMDGNADRRRIKREIRKAMRKARLAEISN